MLETIISAIPEEVRKQFEEKVEVMASNEGLIGFLFSERMITSFFFLIFVFFIHGAVKKIIYHNYNEKLKTQIENKDKSKDEEDEEREEIDKLKIKTILLRNAIVVFVMIGFFFIWKDEIKTTIFSFSFAIMGFVVLFKEILTNLLGGVILGLNRTYKIGDVIEIKGKTGTISDRNLFNTKIIIKENNLNTGREFIVPNSVFLSNEVTLNSRLNHYGVFFLTVFIPDRRDSLIHIKAMKEAAKEVTYNKRIIEQREKLEKKENMEIPSAKPFVSLDLSKEPTLTCKFVTNPKYAYGVREKILTRYLIYFDKFKKESEDEINKQNLIVLDTKLNSIENTNKNSK